MGKNGSKDWQKRKRINFEVKAAFQAWILVRILAVSMLTIIIAAGLSYLHARNVVEAEFLKFQASTTTVSEVFWPVFAAAALTSVIAGLMLALLLPKRIAGPIYRVEQDMKQIYTGDLTKTIRLRPYDILTELADTVNQVVGQIAQMVREVKESSRILENKIHEGSTEEAQMALKHLKEQLDRLNTGP